MKNFLLLITITIAPLNLLFGQSAESFAKNTISKYFRLNCTDTGSAYSAIKTGTYDTYVFWEFKKFMWHLEKLKVTEVEKMNGIDWKGKIKIKAAYFRQYKVCSNSPIIDNSNSCDYWDKWEEVPEEGLFINITKENGQWKDYKVSGAYWTFIPAGDTTVPSCSILKKLKDHVEKPKKYSKG